MNKKILFSIGLFIISLLISWNLFRPGFFSMHDDIQVMRLYEMKRCLNDGQIPCRWAPDMGAGYGQPMFSYYSATPYYTGAIFRSLGFSYLASVKITMFISIFLAGLAMFHFLSEFLSLPAAFIGGLSYILVPYRALEIFVRGALAENFALALLPLVLLGLARLLRKPSRGNFLALSLFTGLFLTSHNVTTLSSSLLLLVFSISLLVLQKAKIRTFLQLFASVVLGLGLSAFFLLPIIFEGHLIDTSFLTTGYFDFHAHFVTLKQLFFDQSWGYGGSEFGPNDTISYAVGIIQTISFVVTPLVLFIKRKQVSQGSKYLAWVFWLLGIFYLFLTNARSVLWWELFSPLRFVQFPWRLLGLVGVSTSVLIGIFLNSFKPKAQKVLLVITSVCLILLNFRFFSFDRYYSQATDDTYLKGEGFVSMQKSAYFDYLPRSIKEIPTSVAPKEPTVINGTVQLTSYQKRSNYFSVEVEVFNDNAHVSFPVTSFPSWTVYYNHSATPTTYTVGEKYGEIVLEFPKGHTTVQAYYENTPLRTLANTLTFVSFLIVLIIATTNNVKKNSK